MILGLNLKKIKKMNVNCDIRISKMQLSLSISQLKVITCVYTCLTETKYHCTSIAGNDLHKQPCLFSDPVELILYMYIMLLFFHAIDTKLIKYCVHYIRVNALND